MVIATHYRIIEKKGIFTFKIMPYPLALIVAALWPSETAADEL